MSRWVYRLGLGLALVALALAFTDWALGLRPGVTEANVASHQTPRDMPCPFETTCFP